MYEIHYTFYNRYNLDFDIIDRPNGSGDYLLLHFVTPMRILLNGRLFVTKENAFIIYNVGTPQYYTAVKTFQNSFVHFSADIDFAKKYRIPLDTVFYPADIDTITPLFESLHLEFFLKRPFYEENVDSFMTQLLVALSRNCNSVSERGDKTSYLFNIFQSARLEILNNLTKAWTSESMAALTGLGTSQFYRYYKDYFGSTPKSDLINARLSKAKELMAREGLSVSEAAFRSGFQTPAHFSRYFRKECHVAPMEWVQRYTGAPLGGGVDRLDR